MQLENTPFSYLVEFDTGAPLGVFSYSLYDDNGDPVIGIHNVQVTPAAGSVSTLIQIPTVANVLTKPLYEGRTIAWYYTTALGAVNGSFSYTVQKRVPFPVTAEGVRIKLGLDAKELPDDRIDLLLAYVKFKERFTSINIDDLAFNGDSTSLKIMNAIEAMAALTIMPSLQLSLAKRLTSGTNEYERWNKIDWESLAAQLEKIIYDVTVLIDVTQVYTATDIFTLAVRTDPFTGV